jgi:hypothetical protein
VGQISIAGLGQFATAAHSQRLDALLDMQNGGSSDE